MKLIAVTDRQRNRNALATAILGFCLAFAMSTELGAQSVLYVSVQGALGSGLSNPHGIAVDSVGNVFVADTGNGRVVEFLANGAQLTIASNLISPLGVAVDQDDDVYVTDTGRNAIEVIPFRGDIYSIGSGLNTPTAVALDAAGDIYIADTGNDRIVVVNGSSLAQATILTSGYLVTSMAVDSSNNLFFVASNDNYVHEIFSALKPATQFGDGLNQPTGVALDRNGNVFVTDTGNGRVVELSSSTGQQTNVAAGMSSPIGIVADAQGNVDVSESPSSSLVQLQTRPADFGTVNVCPEGRANPEPCRQTLTITFDLIDGAVAAPHVSTQGASDLDFTLNDVVNCQTAIPLGYLCVMGVTFNPRAPGLRQGSFQVTDHVGGKLLLNIPLFGTGAAPLIGLSPSVPVTVGASGLNNPTAVAADAAGDVFIVDTYNDRVVKMPAGGGAQTTVGTDLSNPLGVAIDGAGNVFIADYGNQRVVEVPSNGGAQTTVGSGIVGPAGVAVDALGDVLVSDYTNNRVVKIPANGGAETFVGSGFAGPRGLAVDAAGNIFVASGNSGQVFEVPANGGAEVTIGSGLYYPYGVAVDAAGDVLIADYGDSELIQVIPSSGAQTDLVSGLQNPDGVATDGNGDVFVADTANHRVLRLPRASSARVAFATTAVGTTSSDSPRSATVQNIGNRELSITAISYPADFPQNPSAIDEAGFCPAVAVLSIGQACELSIDFTPLHSGSLSESLKISDNSMNQPGAAQTISLTGTSKAAPGIKLSTTTLDFPITMAGKSETMPLTLTNTGTANLDVTSIHISGTNPTEFSETSKCVGVAIKPKGSCTVEVKFDASALGNFVAMLTITDNAGSGSQAMALIGSAQKLPVVKLSSTSLTFPSTKVKSTSSLTLTLTNTGTANLSVTAIGATGSNPSVFTQTTSCVGLPIAPNGHCTVQVKFAPTSVKTFTAALTITDNASNSPQSVSLKGAGH